MSKRLQCSSTRIIILIIILLILSWCIWLIFFIQFDGFNKLPINKWNTPIISDSHENNSDSIDNDDRPILIAYGGDSAAGFATNYFTYPINFILYAKSLNMQLSIEYNERYNNKYYDKNIGDNSFNYFFEPIEIKTKNINNKRIKIPYQNLSFIHHITNSSIHAWYYSDFTQLTFNKTLYNQAWYFRNRWIGSQIVNKYIHPKQEIIKEANEIWNNLIKNDKKRVITLGVQMRGTDKGGFGRHKIEAHIYMPYIINFIKYYINLNYDTKVFIATDDKNYLRYVETYFYYNNYLDINDDSYLYSNIIILQDNVTRSKFRKAVFSMDIDKYGSGKRTLIDILLMAKCDYFLHSASAVAESVHWNNIKLHNKSVHLEYIHNRQIPIWYDPNKYQIWPKYSKLIYQESDKCGITKFPNTLINQYCYGFFSIHALSASHCREACCADQYDGCDTYFWCTNTTIAGRYCKRALCWIGSRKTNQCFNSSGWLGASSVIL